jgi:hypothetical protein
VGSSVLECGLLGLTLVQGWRYCGLDRVLLALKVALGEAVTKLKCFPDVLLFVQMAAEAHACLGSKFVLELGDVILGLLLLSNLNIGSSTSYFRCFTSEVVVGCALINIAVI